jgi:hypothetical protein
MQMKSVIILIIISMAFTANAQTAQQDSAHLAYHPPCAGARVQLLTIIN